MVVVRSDPDELAVSKLLSKQLLDLSLKLIPDSGYIKAGNEISQKVYELLAQKSKYYKAGRFVIAGSIGKKTSIIGSDFDCVIFINDQEPPFEKIVSDFEDIITLSDIPRLTVKKTTKHSLQLIYMHNNGEIKLDLLPATNFVNPPRPSPASESEQALKVYEKLRTIPRNSIQTWSTCLAESNVKFMAKQSGFVHELARLAKFWNSTLLFFTDRYISGRSTIIEMIAIYAGKKEENGSDSPQMLRAFRSFLGLIERLDDPRLVIEFDFNPLSDCIDPSKRKLDTPRLGTSEGKCTIRDGANRFLNLMECLEERDIEWFKFFAKDTIRLLENCYNSNKCWVKYGPGQMNSYFPLELVFQPKPLILPPPQVAEEQAKLKNIEWLVGNETGRSEISPSMKFRTRTKLSPFLIGFIEGIKNYLLINVMTVSANPGVTSDVVKKQVQKCIDKSILDVPERQWGPSSGKKHEDYDVTFIIPFKIGQDKHFSVVSIKGFN